MGQMIRFIVYWALVVSIFLLAFFSGLTSNGSTPESLAYFAVAAVLVVPWFHALNAGWNDLER